MKYKHLLEPLYQSWRINKVLPEFVYGGKFLDIGCDYPPRLINLVKEKMEVCVGVDIAIENKAYENVELRQMDISKKIHLEANQFDIVTMLALLEHMKHPQAVLGECHRILKPGGKLLITVPSPASKPLAEFLARIGLLRQKMIDQHENYFTKNELGKLMQKASFRNISISLFELGLNTFAMAKK